MLQMKPLIFSLVISFSAIGAASPFNQQDRVRFSCSRGASPVRVYTTMLVGVIDWRGTEGSADLALLSRNNCQTSETPVFKTVKRLQMDVYYKETATELLVQMAGGHKRQDLSIVWRSDFPAEMRPNHTFVVDGKTFTFDECRVRNNKDEETKFRKPDRDVCPEPPHYFYEPRRRSFSGVSALY
jgi:hypothetical protein